MAAVPHVQAPVVAVAGLTVQVKDDLVGVAVPEADLTVCVLALATLPCCPATT